MRWSSFDSIRAKPSLLELLAILFVALFPGCGGQGGLPDSTIVATESDSEGLHGLAVDSDDVYFAGGRAQPPGSEQPRAPAGNDSSGFVRSVPRAGGAVTTLWTGRGSAWGVGTAGDNVYFVTFDTGAQGRTGLLHAVPKRGGPDTRPQEWPSGGSALALNGSRVFWILGDATVVGLSTSGGAPSTVWTAPAPLGTLAATPDGATLYAGAREDGRIWRIDLADGSATLPIEGKHAVVSLAADDTQIYWGTDPGGQVVTSPGDRCLPVVLASSQGHPDAVAVDSENVYWVTRSDTTARIRVAARP
jgi:hypothetical protein